MNTILIFTIGIILLRCAAELWLININRKYVLANSDKVPDAFAEYIDYQTYSNSIKYLIDRSKLNIFELVFETLLLLVLLLSGVLPRYFDVFLRWNPESPFVMALFLFSVSFAISLLSLPVDYYYQFKIETRYGFNTTTLKLWVIDKIKVYLLSIIIGLPLLTFIFYLFKISGNNWWLFAGITITLFQIIMIILAPRLIMPLFNKFSQLPDGELKNELLALCEKTKFPVKSIEIMDGSKRSTHSNAFFTGFGNHKKIVLFDTLINQLSTPEIVSVVAHEIGHSKKGHIYKGLILSTIATFGILYLINILINSEWLYTSFGFKYKNPAPAFLLFYLLSSSFSFWLSPVLNLIHRKWEFEADAFSAKITKPADLISALRKLNIKNLSNLIPHPLYSKVYYSHPTLLERETALKTLSPAIKLSQ